MRWIVVVSVILASARTHAQPTSPGPLAQSHAHLDGAARCGSCHLPSFALSNTLCAACHQDVLAKGLHTKTIVIGKTCATCHGDHKGKSFDLQGWRSIPGGIKGFDHDALTDWPLKGRHVAVACVDCHQQKSASGATRFTGLSTACASCHVSDQPHQMTRPELVRCDRCHGESVWKPTKAVLEFDHDTDTAVPIVGAHKSVTCAKCHAKAVFDLPAPQPARCDGCHKPLPHASPLFDQRPCDACHSPTQRVFKAFAFDHDAQTKFPLLAGHKKLDCAKCHAAKLGAALPPATCEACHATANVHGKRFSAIAGGCAACHDGGKKSATRFDHFQHTNHALRGKHSAIECAACHRPVGADNFEKVSGKCKDCHQHKTVHADADHPNGKFTNDQCMSCHGHAWNNPPSPGPTNWLHVYHGPQSQFPLVKGHKNVPCTDCHRKQSSKGKTVFDALPTECGATCHEDSLHQGSLGKQCTACHVSGTWDALRFDHQRTPASSGGRGFLLEGEHRNLKCEECHAMRAFKGTPRACIGCHQQDDAHRGALGVTCDRCHLGNGDNRFNHNAMAKYKLDGKHVDVACEACHPAGAFKPRPMSCVGCHPEPHVHQGQHGTFCEQCHTTKAWQPR